MLRLDSSQSAMKLSAYERTVGIRALRRDELWSRNESGGGVIDVRCFHACHFEQALDNQFRHANGLDADNFSAAVEIHGNVHVGSG